MIYLEKTSQHIDSIDVMKHNIYYFQDGVIRTRDEKELEYISNILKNNLKVAFVVQHKVIPMDVILRSFDEENELIETPFEQVTLIDYETPEFYNYLHHYYKLNFDAVRSNFISLQIELSEPYEEDLYFILTDDEYTFVYKHHYREAQNRFNLGIFERKENGWRFHPNIQKF